MTNMTAPTTTTTSTSFVDNYHHGRRLYTNPNVIQCTPSCAQDGCALLSSKLIIHSIQKHRIELPLLSSIVDQPSQLRIKKYIHLNQKLIQHGVLPHRTGHHHHRNTHHWCPKHNHYYDDIPNDQLLTEDPTALSGVRDFIAGSFAGVASTVVGHPFDTVKVRLQMQTSGSLNQFKGPLDCTIQTFTKEGFTGLYKGMLSPMTTVPLVNAVVFSTYESAKTFFLNRKQSANPNLQPEDLVLSNKEAMMAGAYAGFMNSIVVTPVELIKCRLQAQGEACSAAATAAVSANDTAASNLKPIQYKGTIDCVLKTMQIDGMKGLWKGQSATICREVPSYIGQFGTYELLQQLLSDENKPTALTTMLAGGLAGCVCWTVSYPQDVVKSRLQLQPLGEQAMYKAHRLIPDGGFIHCFRSIVQKEGYMALWKGYSPCLLRAFPANAAGFYTYEMVKQAFLYDTEPQLLSL